MIDLSFEDIPEFRKTEIKKLIKKSINVCVKEMQYKKNFTFQFLSQIMSI